jgi:hypothetical protein
MPSSYFSPQSSLSRSSGMTTYQAIVGDNTVIAKGTEGIRIRDIGDGISKTLLALETNDESAVIWTKPEDWEFDEMKPTKGLEGVWSGNVFLAVFVDVHARAISVDVDPKVFKSFITRNGAEPVSEDELEPSGFGGRKPEPEFEFEEAVPEESFEPPIPVP